MKTLLTFIIFSMSFQLFAQNNVDTVKLEELNRRIEILADEIQKLKSHQLNVAKNESMFGLGPSASKIYQVTQGLSIGGYGEIIFNNQKNTKQDGSYNGTTNKSEVLRQIIYVGYKFDDKWVLNTEIEFEHVNEVYVEFAYLDYLHSDRLNFRSGLILLPVGFLNELHEPVLFPSVLRTEVESRIIPTTWRENGLGIFGNLTDNTSYKFFVVNAMNADGFTKKGLRGGRKKGGNIGEDDNETADNQNADNAAAVLRIDHDFNNNLMAGFAYYAGNASGNTKGNIGVQMAEIHSQYTKGGFRGRFLWTEVKTDGAGERNAIPATPSDFLSEKMHGGYLELMYDVLQSAKGQSLSPFVRFEYLNTQAEIPNGLAADLAQKETNITVGLAYQPLDRIVFKADYTKNRNGAKTGVDEINVGMGFNF